MELRNFKLEEFSCQCGCGMNVSPRLRNMLDCARDDSEGVPFVITSGARCEEHNAKVGGSPTSSHKDGLAVDIAAPDSYSRFRIVMALMKNGFKRIGINDKRKFIHVDIDDSKPQNVLFMY